MWPQPHTHNQKWKPPWKKNKLRKKTQYAIVTHIHDQKELKILIKLN
jgi:hypothetical protein